jgi:hypothetical protein
MYKKTIISLVPHLITLEGHQYVYHQVFQKALPPHISYKAHIPHHSQIGSLPLHWEKSFRKGSHFRPLALLRRFLDFRKILKQRSIEEERYFYLETFNTLELLALSLAVKTSSKKSDRFWLLLRLENKRKFFRFLLRRHPFFLMTDSELIQKIYEEKLQQKVELLPIAHAEVIEKSPPPLKSLKPLCLWIGEPRIAKGLSDIDALLRLQTPSKEDFSFALSKHSLLEKYAEQVHLIPRHLPSQDFYSYLSQASIVFFPYDPQIYRVGTSGIFVEAITYGKMPLAKKGSWLSFELEKYDLHELVVDWQNPNFFSHLKNLLENTKIAHNLKTMQKEYQKFHSRQELQNRIIKLTSSNA